MVRAIRKIKRSLWWFTAPIWPITRILFMGRWRLMWDERDKDKKHIGWLKPEKTVKEFLKHMKSHGFKKHHMAWKHTDELFSIRKIHDETFQYHIRFYRNRQITGHYEPAPEGHFIRHWLEREVEFKKNYFLEIMGHWVMEE